MLGPDVPIRLRFSTTGTFVATSCRTRIPWAPRPRSGNAGTGPAGGRRQIPLTRRLRPSTGRPRAARAAAHLRDWPPRPAAAAGSRLAPLPDVPTLILSGSADMRTPPRRTGACRTLAARVVARAAGNGSLGAPGRPLRLCRAGGRRFFANKPVSARCPTLLARAPAPVRPWPGGAGRPGLACRRWTRRPACTAAGAGPCAPPASRSSTCSPELRISCSSPRGARGPVRRPASGRAIVRVRPRERLRLDRYSYVPGVRISSRTTPDGANVIRLRVRGRAAARGWLSWTSARPGLRPARGRRVGCACPASWRRAWTGCTRRSGGRMWRRRAGRQSAVRSRRSWLGSAVLSLARCKAEPSTF